MNHSTSFFSGMLLGAGMMYLLDPARGNRRRALLRDQVVHAGHELEDAGERLEGRSRDLRNRARGAAAEVRGRMRREEVSDEVLVERVRAEIGRAVSNPRAIDVSASDGRVTLSGPVLESEREALLSTAASVRGVEGIEDRLEAHASAEGVPGLQGSSR